MQTGPRHHLPSTWKLHQLLVHWVFDNIKNIFYFDNPSSWVPFLKLRKFHLSIKKFRIIAIYPWPTSFVIIIWPNRITRVIAMIDCLSQISNAASTKDEGKGVGGGHAIYIWPTSFVIIIWSNRITQVMAIIDCLSPD